MSRTPDIADLDLHAFIDGELDAEHAVAFEARMKADPALAERVAAYRADKEMLLSILIETTGALIRATRNSPGIPPEAFV